MSKTKATFSKKPARAGLARFKLFLFAALFLVSGTAGLIYEIVWERLLELYFGVTMVAITLIVSAYMAGLGLGSLFGGRVARRVKFLLFVYGAVEIGIGLFGVVSPSLFTWVGQATAGSPYWLVFLLSFALLLIPTFLMGMTLPLLSQAFIERVDVSGQVVGLLYGINTLGAAAGSALAGYLLIGHSGLDGAIRYAFYANAGIGLLAILFDRWRALSRAAVFPSEKEKTVPRRQAPWGYRSLLLASFLTGFLGLGYEMLWIRVLHITNKSTVYSFPTVLAVFLFGLAVGGYLWGRRADQTDDPAGLFIRLELAVGLTAGLCFLALYHALNLAAIQAWLSENFTHFQQPVTPMVAPEGGFVFSRRALFYSLLAYLPPFLLLILPASLLMGGGLPVLDRLAIESPQVAGRRVGEIHLANILGSVLGSLVISFILLPGIGSEWTLKTLIAASLIFPLLGWLNRRQFRLERGWWPFLASLLALLLLLPGRGLFYTRLYESGTGERAVIHETAETVLALTYRGAEDRTLWIGGEINSRYPSPGYWEAQALNCAAASHPDRILVIGYGGGHTAYFATLLPGVEQITLVELIPDLIPFLAESTPLTQITLSDPRLDSVADDGRRYLYAHPEARFDLIIIDPLRNYTAGHNNLYSLEALTLYREHLTPGGVFCAWHDEYHIIPATLAAAFPYVDQYGDYSIASSQPLVYDLDYMNFTAERFLISNPERSPASIYDYFVPTTILQGFIRDQDQIRRDEAETPLLRDLYPYLEYYISNVPFMPLVVGDPATRPAFAARLSGCDAACQEAIIDRR
ncbi:MAG: fused MFS/spermidine synthase [Anaerolineales bacterium]